MKQHSTVCNQNPKNLPNNSEDERKRKALAKMIILDKLPLSSVQTVSFKRFMEALCPDFTIPSVLTIARDCCEYYLEKKKKLKKLFTENKQRVCLTVDIWTSEEGLDYMCLTAQW
ncbi:putative Zinc finger BED domain-containing protein [Helianthus anomalus]